MNDVSNLQDVKEIEELRESIIETRREIHKRNEEEVSRRWSYEEGVGVYQHREYLWYPGAVIQNELDYIIY